MRYGILTDITHQYHWIFLNYYYSLKNVFGENNVKLVKSINDLNDIDALFIGDEHFLHNKGVWMTHDFINKCNTLGLKVFIFNNEKIHNSVFPWNEDIQRHVGMFNNHKQFVYDCDDADILNVKINKTYMSKEFKKTIPLNDVIKNDKIVFFGNTKGSFSGDQSYVKRNEFLNEIKKELDIDIIESSKGVPMADYFNTISKYKYILSPLGNGNFVPMRYYESLFVKSIPLQQSTDNIISKFGNEITNNRGIFFKDINDLIKNLDNHKTHNNEEYFMEDFINDEILPLLI
jgi:hypothetical protein